jgi:hypothetical protein
MVTTFFGVDHPYSLAVRYYMMPVGLAHALVFFVAGFFFHEKLFLKRIVFCSGIYVLMVISFSATEMRDFSQTRVIYGLDVPLALVAALFLQKFRFGLLLFLGALISLKKTVLICSMVAATSAFFFMFEENKKFLSSKKTGYFLIFLIIFFIVTLNLREDSTLGYISLTLNRIASEGFSDPIRWMSFHEFTRLLGDYFPWGTGYYTFGSLTMDTIPYNTKNADGTLFSGLSLHNTPMHVLLEGGAVVFAVYIALYWQAFRYIYSLFKSAESRNIAILLLFWIVVSFIYGLFNHLHSQIYYFGIFGFIFGVHARYKMGRFFDRRFKS